MALFNFRRCRGASCTDPQTPSDKEVKEVYLPKMMKEDMLILSYTRVTRVVAHDEPALLLTAAPQNGERQYAFPDCNKLGSECLRCN